MCCTVVDWVSGSPAVECLAVTESQLWPLWGKPVPWWSLEPTFKSPPPPVFHTKHHCAMYKTQWQLEWGYTARINSIESPKVSSGSPLRFLVRSEHKAFDSWWWHRIASAVKSSQLLSGPTAIHRICVVCSEIKPTFKRPLYWIILGSNAVTHRSKFKVEKSH